VSRIDRAALSRIAAACRLGIPIETNDRIALAVAVESWLSGSAPSLDTAFNVRRGRGQRSNRTTAAKHSRDDLLRECAQRFTGNRRKKAEQIATAGARYTAGPWRHDRAKPTLPPAYAGTPKAVFWEILKSGEKIPAWRRLMCILASGETVQPNAPISLHHEPRMLLRTNTKGSADARTRAQAYRKADVDR
jgi:hypothetical protein